MARQVLASGIPDRASGRGLSVARSRLHAPLCFRSNPSKFNGLVIAIPIRLPL
jgi:hypothetical protein